MMPKLLIGLGLVLIIIGLVWHLFPGALSWIGRLPGDIRHEGEHGGFYFPIVSMIIISIVLTVIVNLWQR